MDTARISPQTKILVVDDVHAITDTLAAILSHFGYETAKAYSGEEAIATSRSFQPDCLLSDIVMGSMNGVDAAIEIRQSMPQCKVMFLTGESGNVPALGKATEQGIDFVLMNKPIQPIQLLTVVKLFCPLAREEQEIRTDRKELATEKSVPLMARTA